VEDDAAFADAAARSFESSRPVLVTVFPVSMVSGLVPVASMVASAWLTSLSVLSPLPIAPAPEIVLFAV
jgi:hypothetical protein